MKVPHEERSSKAEDELVVPESLDSTRRERHENLLVCKRAHGRQRHPFDQRRKRRRFCEKKLFSCSDEAKTVLCSAGTLPIEVAG